MVISKNQSKCKNNLMTCHTVLQLLDKYNFEDNHWKMTACTRGIILSGEFT